MYVHLAHWYAVWICRVEENQASLLWWGQVLRVKEGSWDKAVGYMVESRVLVLARTQRHPSLLSTRAQALRPSTRIATGLCGSTPVSFEPWNRERRGFGLLPVLLQPKRRPLSTGRVCMGTSSKNACDRSTAEYSKLLSSFRPARLCLGPSAFHLSSLRGFVVPCLGNTHSHGSKSSMCMRIPLSLHIDFSLVQRRVVIALRFFCSRWRVSSAMPAGARG